MFISDCIASCYHAPPWKHYLWCLVLLIPSRVDSVSSWSEGKLSMCWSWSFYGSCCDIDVSKILKHVVKACDKMILLPHFLFSFLLLKCESTITWMVQYQVIGCLYNHHHVWANSNIITLIASMFKCIISEWGQLISPHCPFKFIKLTNVRNVYRKNHLGDFSI